MILRGTILLLLIFTAPGVYGATSPLAISIAAPIQFPPSGFDVTGLRISALWGKHRSMLGIDVGGLGNVTDQQFTGIGISGIFNYTKGNVTAVLAQIAGITNINNQKTNVYGIQAAVGANINSAESTILGIQIALANLCAHTTVTGFQLGIYNKSKRVNGFQIGLINVTDELKGLQIGLLNFYAKGVFEVSPILNFGF